MGIQKVVIVEDHRSYRKMLVNLLSTVNGFEIVGEAADGLQAISLIKRKRPDLVLLDLSIPKMKGISVIKAVKNQLPEVKILILTMYDYEDYVFNAFQSGVEGYCLKDTGRDELFTAINRVLDGKIYISPRIPRSVVEVLCNSEELNFRPSRVSAF